MELTKEQSPAELLTASGSRVEEPKPTSEAVFILMLSYHEPMMTHDLTKNQSGEGMTSSWTNGCSTSANTIYTYT